MSSRPSPIPLYQQVKEFVKKGIEEGAFPEGASLPTEFELVERFKVSRSTVRQALSELLFEGYLYKVQGKGSFVAKRHKPPQQIGAVDSRTVGFVLPTVYHSFSSDVLRGASKAANELGYHVVFYASQHQVDKEQSYLRSLWEGGVGGIILWPIHDEEESPVVTEMISRGFPCVVIDTCLANTTVDSVVSDNFGGAYQATDYLTRLGHTRIGFITLPYMKTASIRSRLEGYQSALEHNDIPFDEHLVLNVVEYGEYLDSSNEAARSERIRAFLEEARPTAVFCITDDIALDVLKVAHMEGIRIPAEVSVVGFDDVEYAKLVNPPLTTVAQRRERLGRQAMKLVNDRIKGNLTKPKRVVIPTYLVTRGSTAPLGGTSESRDTSSAALSLR